MQQARICGEREIPSIKVGEFVMNELRKLDHVGYVRFASVYRSFEDVADFREEIDREARTRAALQHRAVAVARRCDRADQEEKGLSPGRIAATPAGLPSRLHAAR